MEFRELRIPDDDEVLATLINARRDLLRVLTESDNFESPLDNKKLNSWEDYAHRMKNDAVIGSPMQILYQFLEVWYVALRMVVQSWEEEQQLVWLWLIFHDGLHKHGWYGPRIEDS